MEGGEGRGEAPSHVFVLFLAEPRSHVPAFGIRALVRFGVFVRVLGGLRFRCKEGALG